MAPCAEDAARFWDLEAHGGKIALVMEDGSTCTYTDLARRADDVVRPLAQRHLILIEAENSIDSVAAYFGALRSKHSVLIVPADIMPAALNTIKATFRPSAGFRRIQGVWSLWQSGEAPPPLHPDLALMLSTSGSTGSAKLVRLSADAIAANAQSIASYLEITSEDRAVTTLPLHYSYGLSVLNSHILVGASVALTNRSVVDPAFRAFIDRVEATSLAGVPYTYELLERIGFRDNPPLSITCMTQAGGRLPSEIAALYAGWASTHSARFFTMYGQTEAVARIAYMPSHAIHDYPDCIGVAIPGGQLSLIDGSGAVIEASEVEGELVYRGPNVMMGYATTAEHLAAPAELTELRLGDMAMRNGAGFYRIIGRRSRFIKPFGVRIGLDDVETMLAARGLTAIASGTDELLAVRLVGIGTDPASVVHDLAKALHIPSALIHVSASEDRPLLPSGKTDYHAVLAYAQKNSLPADEQTNVALVFETAFPGQDISSTSSFVSLGGDSLNYVGVSIALEGLIGSLPNRWEELDVAELERRVPVQPLPPPTWWQLRAIESEVLIRATAITGVVSSHATQFPVSGGADTLLMLFGYNLSRYQYGRLVDGRGADLLISFFARIVAPYVLILALYAAVIGDLPWTSLFLVSNFEGRFQSFLEPFWFLEALSQIVVLVTALFIIAPVRRAVARKPWESGLAALAASLGLALTLNIVVARPELHFRTPELLFWLVALGWCLHRAIFIRRQLLVLVVGSAILIIGYLKRDGLELGFPNTMSQQMWFLTTILLVGWLPRIPLPNVLHGLIATIAASSFYIYLIHIVPLHILQYTLHQANPSILIPAGLLSGVALWWCVQQMEATAWLHRRLWRRRGP